MKLAVLMIATSWFPMVSNAGGSAAGMASELSTCETMKPNRERIKKNAANEKVTPKCREALAQAEDCYNGREATKADARKLQGMDDAVETPSGEKKAQSTTQLQAHSAESLAIGRGQFNRNKKLCSAVNENIKKQCRGELGDLRTNRKVHEDAVNELNGRSLNPQDPASADLRRQAGVHKTEAMRVREQELANEEAMKAASEGLGDESKCNATQEQIYAHYEDGVNNGLKLASANGETPDKLVSKPLDGHGEVIDEKRDSLKPVRDIADEKTAEVVKDTTFQAGKKVLHAMGPAGKMIEYGATAAFPAYSASHKDLAGTATGLTGLAGEVVGSRGLALGSTGAGVFAAAYFYQDPNFMRCSEIYYDPIKAAKAGGCPITTTGGSYATQSAAQVLAGD